MFSALLSKIWNNCVYFVILLFCRSSWQIAQLLHIINKKNPKEWRRYKLSKTNTRTEEIPFLFNYKLNNIRNLRICTKPFNSCSLSLLTSDMWWVAGTRQQQQYKEHFLTQLWTHAQTCKCLLRSFRPHLQRIRENI